jgi:hypothetical protein
MSEKGKETLYVVFTVGWRDFEYGFSENLEKPNQISKRDYTHKLEPVWRHFIMPINKP